MKINRRVDRIERIDRVRKVEQTEKENEKDRDEQFNNSLAYIKKQRTKKEDLNMENKELQRDKIVADINAIKSQMEGSNLGRITKLKQQLNGEDIKKSSVSIGKVIEKYEKSKEVNRGELEER